MSPSERPSGGGTFANTKIGSFWQENNHNIVARRNYSATVGGTYAPPAPPPPADAPEPQYPQRAEAASSSNSWHSLHFLHFPRATPNLSIAIMQPSDYFRHANAASGRLIIMALN
jgi:hypothetical protein